MRTAIYTAITMLILQTAASRAEKVKFEFDEGLFEPAIATEHVPSFFNYDTTLYDGLWPMTIEAFRRMDWEDDKEVFTFTIASLDAGSLRDSFWKATRDKFAEMEQEPWPGFSR